MARLPSRYKKDDKEPTTSATRSTGGTTQKTGSTTKSTGGGTRKKSLSSGSGRIGAGSGGGAGASGSSGTSAGSRPSSTGSRSASADSSPTSTGYVNIGKYLGANQEAGADMAEGVAGTVSDRVTTGTEGINSAYNTFESKANASDFSVDDNVLGNVRNDATSVTGDDQAMSSFNRMANAEYGGPQRLDEIKGYDKSAKSLRRGVTDSQNLGMGSYRKGLLNDTYGRPDYSGGMMGLDNAIMGANDQARGIFEDTAQQYKGADSLIGERSGEAKDLASQRSQQAQDARKAALNALTSGVGNVRSGLESERDQLNEQRDTEYQELRGNLFGSLAGPSEDAMRQVGLDDVDKFYGVSPVDYLSKGQDASIHSVADQDDRARLAALKELGAGGTGFLQDAEGPGKAYNFDRSKFMSDWKARKQKANQKKKITNDSKPAKPKKAKSSGQSPQDKYGTSGSSKTVGEQAYKYGKKGADWVGKKTGWY